MPLLEQAPHDQDVFDVIRDPREGGTERLSNRFTLAWLQWLFKLRAHAIAHAPTHLPGGSDPLTDVAFLDAVNIFTANQYIANATPALNLNETDRGADLKRWRLSASSEILRWAALSDDESAFSELLTLDRAGVLAVIGLLNLTSGQMKFPATQNASADANTLDDYEKGILWTPVLTFATPGDLAVTYTSQFGRCTKIGNRVFGAFNIITSAFTYTTAVGALTITGLPTPHVTSSGSANYGAVGFSGITKAGYTSIYSFIGSGASSILFNACGSGVALSGVTAADMPSGGTVVLQGNFAYEAAT